MKTTAYHLFALIGLLALCTACSSDKVATHLPQLFLERASYSLAKGSVEIKVKADQAPSADITVPVHFGGTAIEGTDFTAPEKSVVIKAGETEGSLRLDRIPENIGDENKTLYVNLGTAPQGFELGLINYTSVTLLSNKGLIMTFENSSQIMSENCFCTVSLMDLNGKPYRLPAAEAFALEVDPASTAVEGVHFQFADGATAKIGRRKSAGTVALKFLKKEEGKDKIVLRLAARDGYAYGTNGTTEIKIQGPYVLTGTWAFDRIANLSYLENGWGADVSEAPKGTSDDRLIFAGASHLEYQFTPELQGDLKNYFTAPCKVTYQGEALKDLHESNAQVSFHAAILRFDAVNVHFDANKSQIRPAVAGFRILQIDGKEVLECTIDDYEPTAFFTALYDDLKTWGEEPVMKSLPLRIYFTRVK